MFYRKLGGVRLPFCCVFDWCWSDFIHDGRRIYCYFVGMMLPSNRDCYIVAVFTLKTTFGETSRILLSSSGHKLFLSCILLTCLLVLPAVCGSCIKLWDDAGEQHLQHQHSSDVMSLWPHPPPASHPPLSQAVICILSTPTMAWSWG